MKPLPSRRWADWCTTDFNAIDKTRAIAVLPVAATEQHGPHLPLSVDTDLADAILHRAEAHLPDDLPALWLPTLTIGYSPEHSAFAGTLTLKAETVLRLWTDVAESVAASGIQKMVIFNTHGGNVGLMDVAARDWRVRLEMLVYGISWFNLPLIGDDGEDVGQRFASDEHRFGIHAGEIETAMMRALKPERVNMAAAQHFASTSQTRAEQFDILGNGRSAKLAWQMQDYNTAGAVGNAAAATADSGHALLDAAGRALAKALVEIDRLPPDTLRSAS